ncbi:MAG: hypothetical protein Q8L89_06630 [Gammaproteobacteria bacterium]|nr:hypothetical protein [Gammaproteobacteria bacterium]
MKQIICLKWGDKYPADYVNKLYGMVSRNLSGDFRFVCLTDDRHGIRPEVEIKAMPAFDLPESLRRHPFRRMFIFQERLEDIKGDVLHLDLDLVVTGSLDGFFDYKPDLNFVVAENWTQPGQGIGNMSVFRFRVGALTKVWERFRPDPMEMMRLYRNSQTFVCRTLGQVEFFPSEWCISFKHSIVPRWPLNFVQTPRLPENARIVVFTGKPDPHEAVVGVWPAKWYKRLYKHIRPAVWINDYWRE